MIRCEVEITEEDRELFRAIKAHPIASTLAALLLLAAMGLVGACAALMWQIVRVLG